MARKNHRKPKRQMGKRIRRADYAHRRVKRPRKRGEK